jgi:hypothetical protein
MPLGLGIDTPAIFAEISEQFNLPPPPPVVVLVAVFVLEGLEALLLFP